MEPAEELVQTRRKVELVKGINSSSLKPGRVPIGAGSGIARADLDVFPLPPPDFFRKKGQHLVQFFGPIHERLAVVGKWERNEPAPGEPALHAANGQPICQFGSRPRRR